MIPTFCTAVTPLRDSQFQVSNYGYIAFVTQRSTTSFHCVFDTIARVIPNFFELFSAVTAISSFSYRNISTRLSDPTDAQGSAVIH